MNKAFTANINDQVTARDYLDENNQLIMLEPEGSGGGDSDFTIANVSVKSTNLSDGVDVSYRLPIIEELEGEDPVIFAGDSLTIGKTYKVPVYKGNASGFAVAGIASVTVESGDATTGLFNSLSIHGDCTIVINGGE